MKKLIVILSISSIIALLSACNSKTGSENENNSTSSSENGNPSYDPNRGTGKFTHLDLSEKLDPAKATAGEKIFTVKCSSCHKLTTEKLVGPGWAGVTSRHKPEWIMNFVTNTDEMINKDPYAQAQLEICLVRMPNQSLSDDDARSLLEFMRKNDGLN